MAFNNQTAAFALLFSDDDDNKAIRVEAPDLGLEFTDGLPMGRDMEGILQYNHIGDFHAIGNHHYTVTMPIINGDINCVVDFRLDAIDAAPYAKFVGPDPAGIVAPLGMNDFTAIGNWQPLAVLVNAATLYKPAGVQTFTITIPDFGIEATFGPHNAVPLEPAFEVEGRIHYMNVPNLLASDLAKFNNDYTIFYENDLTGENFRAFFIPIQDDLLIVQALTDVIMPRDWA